jgi:hypothetical protein
MRRRTPGERVGWVRGLDWALGRARESKLGV